MYGMWGAWNEPRDRVAWHGVKVWVKKEVSCTHLTSGPLWDRKRFLKVGFTQYMHVWGTDYITVWTTGEILWKLLTDRKNLWKVLSSLAVVPILNAYGWLATKLRRNAMPKTHKDCATFLQSWRQQRRWDHTHAERKTAQDGRYPLSDICMFPFLVREGLHSASIFPSAGGGEGLSRKSWCSCCFLHKFLCAPLGIETGSHSVKSS